VASGNDYSGNRSISWVRTYLLGFTISQIIIRSITKPLTVHGPTFSMAAAIATRFCLLFTAIFLSAVSSRTVAAAFTQGQARPPFSPLGTGDYVWQPEFSPMGPVVIIVSVPEQTLYVYRNGVRIGRSTVSTGKPGHATPTGVFTILQKEVHHRSNLYHGAPMPYMERVTWGGVALHAGQLPGYPASHGCVRLPMDFAEKLYTVTENGTTVILADDRSAPRETVHPGLFFSASTGESSSSALKTGDYLWKPELASTGPVTIIVSTTHGVVFVYRNGVEIGRAFGSIPESERIGIQAFTALDKTDAAGHRKWLAIAAIGGDKKVDVSELARRSSIPAPFLQKVREVVTVGTTLILSDLAVSPDTQSKPGFNILTASGPPSGTDQK
jgi:L,D-transpeptidase catalytic domain